MNAFLAFLAATTWLLPQFITERSALIRCESGGYTPLTPMEHLRPSDHYDAVATVSYFSFLGWPFFVQYLSPIVPRLTFPEIKDDLDDR